MSNAGAETHNKYFNASGHVELPLDAYNALLMEATRVGDLITFNTTYADDIEVTVDTFALYDVIKAKFEQFFGDSGYELIPAHRLRLHTTTIAKKPAPAAVEEDKDDIA
jgi:hypothetical protein